MNTQIKISDFVKLTRSTLKTVLYYHEIGLLKEPKRTPSGYRLYGPEELAQMRMIKHFKNLGFDLKQIKDIMGDTTRHSSLSEVLYSLQTELLDERKKIDEQLSKIEILLKQDSNDLKKMSFESTSFQMINQILAPIQEDDTLKESSELQAHHHNVFGIIEDFQWGKDYNESFKAIAEYFKANPAMYQTAVDFGKRLGKLKELSEDDPEIENLAREGAEFVKSAPFLKEMLYGQTGLGTTNESLLNEMVQEVLTPAQMKHKKLIQKYLNYNP